MQVHHKKQISFRDKPTLAKLSDLAVVCANCHMLIHADPMRALPLQALRRLLRVSKAARWKHKKMPPPGIVLLSSVYLLRSLGE